MSALARFTGAKNMENTARGEQFDYQAIATASIINLGVKGNAARTLFNIALATPTPTININVGDANNPPYVGDEVQMIITPDATTRVITWGTGFIPTAATLSATASKITTASFVFNGTGWVQRGSSTTA
jgi:hypothetical protein